MKLANLAIKRPTFITSILVGIIFIGIVCYEGLSVKLFPAFNISSVIVYTIYPSADIKEIEELVTKPIEDFLASVAGLDTLESVSQDNIYVVICSFKSSKNSDEVINEVRNKIFSVRDLLREGIKDPIVMKADFNSNSLVVINLKSDTMSIQEIHSFANDVVKMDLEQIEGVAEANVIGGTKREIHVVADRKKLEERGLFLTALAKRIELNTFNVPAGNINRKGKEVYVVTSGQFESLKQMESSVINFIANDTPVLLKDVANVEDSFAEESLKARVDRKIENTVSYTPSVLINVFGQVDANDVAVAGNIYEEIAELNEEYKKYKGSPYLEIIDDFSSIVRKNIDDAKNSIVLVNYIQQLLRSGKNMQEAIIQTCVIRFRPIVMTSIALIAGTFSMALGLSEVGKFRQSMGIVVIGGVISSTILSLIIIPAMFEYCENLKHFLRKITGRTGKRIIDLSEEQLKAKNYNVFKMV
jgi:HAE1 family hydrophobic/amphiphilic exporter-1